MLRVSYENWGDWNGAFGHIFYNGEFSHYRLRVEYRFVGDQVKNGPGWAFRNSGIMFHGQSVESMEVDQDFPVSIEYHNPKLAPILSWFSTLEIEVKVA